jgi:prepilin-type N-terminal cleavage/methylation domain-containing protein
MAKALLRKGFCFSVLSSDSRTTESMRGDVMRRSSGFALIELMIVVAIIAILASLAVSAYSVYVARTQFSKALTITDGMKRDVLDYYHQTGQCPFMGGVASGLESSSASYAAMWRRRT